MISQIMTISPLDGRYNDKVKSLNSITSEHGLNKYRIRIEIEWFKFLFIHAKIGLPKLSDNDAKLLDHIYLDFDIEQAVILKKFEQITNHDVKAVEYYIKDRIANYEHLYKYHEYIHFGCTSEDINNLSYALMLNDALKCVLIPELEMLIDKLSMMSNLYKNICMMSHTHGQPATPTTVGKEIYNVVYRLRRQIKQLKDQEILGKFNGAVGNYNAHVIAYPDIMWHKLAQEFVEGLGITFNPYTTQIEPHDYVAEIFNNLQRINTILIDFARDMWMYISFSYFKQKINHNEVGSSTMPHKVNPIDFENAEGNLGIANALSAHFAEKLPISRLQRDLSDSTVQRNFGVALGYSVVAYNSLLKGVSKLEVNQDIIDEHLDNNWELLAEPIQTVMRKYGIKNPYEKLKDLTRGKKLNRDTLSKFIAELDIPECERDKLLRLTPKSYIGLASKLVDNE